MRLKKIQKTKSKNDFKLKFLEPKFSSLNRTLDDSFITKTSKIKSRKSIIYSTKNKNKLKLNNNKNATNEILTKKNLL